MKKIFRKAVFIAVYRINPKNSQIEYLILHRTKHWKGYEFPKGGIDAGETSLQTAKREVFEESGLRAIKLKKYPINGKYLYKKTFKDRPGLIGQTYILFSAQVLFGKKVKIDRREHSSHRWMNFDEATKILTYGNQRRLLKFVNRSLRK